MTLRIQHLNYFCEFGIDNNNPDEDEFIIGMAETIYDRGNKRMSPQKGRALRFIVNIDTFNAIKDELERLIKKTMLF